MKKHSALSVVMLALALARIPAQESTDLIDTYRRNFVRSSLGTKLELLKEASAYESVNMGPLYDTAVQFVLGNIVLLANDPLMRDMAILSVTMIRTYNYAPASENMWSLLGVYKDAMVRVAILQTLAETATGNKTILREMNAYLDNQITLFKAGSAPDASVLDATVYAVGQLGDSSSFPFLFSAYMASVSLAITNRASTAMASLNGDYAAFLTEVIQTHAPSEKAAALEAGLQKDALPADKRAELAETALSVGVSYQGAMPADQSYIMALRTSAARELTARGWQKASPLAIKHFYDFQIQYSRGQVSKSDFLDSIGLLGAMGTTEAAQALALYLQLINTETEQGKALDEQITLAVVNNLGLLGDKIAFDYLLYIGYLQYPEPIKKAARDALQKLRW
jgi:hypothetical protein